MKKKRVGRKRTTHAGFRACQARYAYALKRKPSKRALNDIYSFIKLLERRGLEHNVRRAAHALAVERYNAMRELVEHTSVVNFYLKKVEWVMSEGKKVKGSKKSSTVKKTAASAEDKMLMDVTNKLLKGEEVAGFTLIPEHKAEGNHTVDIIMKIKGSGLALCSRK